MYKCIRSFKNYYYGQRIGYSQYSQLSRSEKSNFVNDEAEESTSPLITSSLIDNIMPDISSGMSSDIFSSPSSDSGSSSDFGGFGGGDGGGGGASGDF